jgi:hypothetical protein
MYEFRVVVYEVPFNHAKNMRTGPIQTLQWDCQPISKLPKLLLIAINDKLV